MLWRTSLLERKHGASVTGFRLTYKSFFNSGMRCLRDMAGSEGRVAVGGRRSQYIGVLDGGAFGVCQQCQHCLPEMCLTLFPAIPNMNQ